MLNFRKSLLLVGLLLHTGLCGTRAHAEMAADQNADVSVPRPAFARGQGPMIVVDGGHHNYHRVDNRFKPFAELLRNDGYRVAEFTGPATRKALQGAQILVIANALNAANENNWVLPTPSAFATDEIQEIAAWVREGGSLLLIADHFPFAGAATDLAAAFGFSFVNGFALRVPTPVAEDTFTRTANALKDDAVVRGRAGDAAVTKVTTFTGSAFLPPAGARALLAFPDSYEILLPSVAWQFTPTTPRRATTDTVQGAVMPFGKGRVAVFGEAAMFSAQFDPGPPPARMGFNLPSAGENKQFVLNIAHWLSRLIEP